MRCIRERKGNDLWVSSSCDDGATVVGKSGTLMRLNDKGKGRKTMREQVRMKRIYQNGTFSLIFSRTISP